MGIEILVLKNGVEVPPAGATLWRDWNWFLVGVR